MWSLAEIQANLQVSSQRKSQVKFDYYFVMIIYINQRSRKRKPNAKQRQLAADWDALVKKHAAKPVSKKLKVEPYVPPKAYVRETPYIPSLKDFTGNATKPVEGKRYTGSKIIGIGTLHKSNAVPIFSDEEAKDQASMRR